VTPNVPGDVWLQPDDATKPKHNYGNRPPMVMQDEIQPTINEAIKKAKKFNAHGTKECPKQSEGQDPCVCAEAVNAVPARRWIVTNHYSVHSDLYKGTFSFTLTFEYYWEGPTGTCEDDPDPKPKKWYSRAPSQGRGSRSQKKVARGSRTKVARGKAAQTRG
jgi:hypothetical protein